MALQNIEANITLDLYNHDTTPTTIKAIQLDSETRYVAARLQNMGTQYDMDSGATVQLTVIRPDKVGVQISGTTFTYGDEGAQFLGPYAELTLVALAVSGKLLGQFKITSGTQILRTEIFTISAGVALDASTDEWAGQYDGYNLDELVEKVDTAVSKVDGMEADVSDLKSDLSEMSEIINGESNISIPMGYESASYANSSGTRAYKFENNKLHLHLSGTTIGSVSATEVSSSNANLTIGESIAYALATDESPALKLDYVNNVSDALVVIRFYNDAFSKMKTYNPPIPVGTGSMSIDLRSVAEASDIDTEIYPNVIIRALGWGAHISTEAEATDIYINGFAVTSDGIVERISVLETENAALNLSVGLLNADVNAINTAANTDVNKALAVKQVVDGKVIEWQYLKIGESEQTDNTYLSRQVIPDYYFAYPENPTSFDEQSYLEDVIAKIPDGKSFIFITDTHWESNAKNAFKLIQYIRQKTGIKKVVFGGDCIDREDTKYKGLNVVREFMANAIDSIGADDFLVAIGNHDSNMANVITSGLDSATYRIPYDKMYDAMISHLENVAAFEDLSTQIGSVSQSETDTAELTGWSKLHYYVDDADEMTRYVVIYSSCPDDVFLPTYTGFASDSGGGPSTVMQYEWFAETLMSTPTGYDVVVVAHCADSEGTTSPSRQVLRNYFDYFTRIASAFHKKCTGFKLNVVLFDENACPSNAFWTRETKIWDFSTAPNVGKIIFVAGHIHRNVEYVTRITTDSTVNPTYEKGKARNNGNPAISGVEIFDSAVVDYGSGEVVTLISQCDGYGQAIGAKYPNELAEMAIDTITEQSFDIITLTNTGIVCTKVGAGWDRMIPVKWG